MALTKAEMSERLFEELGLNKREAKEIVELFFEEIRASLESNENVKLSGFGNFDLRDKKERPGRNPKTGEEIPISARRVVTFKPGTKTKTTSRNLCWNRAITKNYRLYLERDILLSVRLVTFCGVKSHVLRYWEQEVSKFKACKKTWQSSLLSASRRHHDSSD